MNVRLPRFGFPAVVAAVLAALLLALLGVAGIGCRASTQITVTVTTDVPCDHFGGAAITVGALGVIDGTSAASTTTTCVDGKVGALVIVPSGANDEPVAFRVVAGVDERFDDCLAETPGPKCIVARRALHFIPHTSLKVPIALNLVCEGVPCSPDSTCVNHACVSATIDPGKCTGELGCPFEGSAQITDGGGPSDAGVDATLRDGGVDSGEDASTSGDGGGDGGADGSTVLAAVPGCVMSGLQANAPWPMFGYCPSHRHRSPMRGPKTASTLAWRVALDGIANDQPIVAADGTIYVVTDANAVYALRPDGTTKWKTTFPSTNGKLRSDPAIGADGTIFLSDSLGSFYRVEPSDGGITTVRGVFNGSRTGITIGPDGTLYIGDTSTLINAITPQGTVRWTADMRSGVDPQSPSYGADGLLYVQTAAALSALAPADGGIQWSFGYDGSTGTETPQIAPNGVVVVGVPSGALGIRPGSPPTQAWAFKGTGTQIAFSVGDDGTTYFSSDNDPLTAIGPDGGVRAVYPNRSCSVPVIDADGWVYAICGGPVLVALDATLHEQWKLDIAEDAGPLGIILESPVIGIDGHIYVNVWNQGNSPDTILAFAAP